MTMLHRHQLVRRTDAGWRELRERPWDDEARACIDHWAACRLPLVVTRQAVPIGPPQTDETLALGLAAPLRWRRRRLALAARRRDVAGFAEFPGLEPVLRMLPAPLRQPWRRLGRTLAAIGARPRVYGSHGWQCLTTMTYVHPQSDLDLWTAVDGVAQADAASAAFDDFAAAGAPRLDGELLFPDGRAVAWREWRAWRAGHCRSVLTKSLAGASLVKSW